MRNDVCSVPGAVAAAIVAMVGKTDGFSIHDDAHRESVKKAIAELVPAYAEAISAAQCSSERGMFAD